MYHYGFFSIVPSAFLEFQKRSEVQVNELVRRLCVDVRLVHTFGLT